MEFNAIQEILHKRFGLGEFRRGQREIIESVISRRDTMAVMPTGGGKSLCYQLPALHNRGVTLVISPLIALMRDQVAALKARGIAAGSLHSGQDMEDKREVFREMARSESFLLYVSPERVQKEGFATWIRTAPVTLIAVDEAHCLSQWGPDFRPDYYKLELLRELRPDVPILALTATATPRVLGDIRARLKLDKPDRHVYGFYRPNLYYQVESCDSESEKQALLEAALAATPEGRVIIYCGTRKQCEEASEALASRFKGVDHYHAGLTAEQRKQVEAEYAAGKTRILAATNAFGMGVDHPDVRLVVHIQMPANIESYYQEIGRAGRDGAPSTCLLLYSKRDKGLHSYFIRTSEAPDEIIQHRWRALDTIVQYAEGGECRHSGILTYFKDTQRITRCGHCDVCDPGSARKISRPARPADERGLRKRRRSAAEATPVRPLTGLEQLRAERVREWRAEYARERDIPAFLVFSNRTVDDLVKRDPADLESLEAVHGLGPNKIKVFGASLLECLAETRG